MVKYLKMLMTSELFGVAIKRWQILGMSSLRKSFTSSLIGLTPVSVADFKIIGGELPHELTQRLF